MNRADIKRQLLIAVFQQAAKVGRLPAVTVGDVMTPSPLCVKPNLSALDLVHLFHEKRFRHMLVSEQGRLVGIISDRDVVRLFGTHDAPEREYLEKITAGELMSTNLITVNATTTLIEAVGLIVDNGISCLPVVSGPEAIGILTSTDLYLSLEQLLLSVLTEPVTA